MCFSATASFIASGAIGTIGAASLLEAPNGRERAYASVPFIFAAQQAVEGVVWLTLGRTVLNDVLVKSYLVFAYAFWPAYIPWAVRMSETSPMRRRMMLPLVIAGWVIGTTGLVAVILSPTPVILSCSHLVYGVPMINPLYGLFYVGVGTLVCLLSSSRWIVTFGLALVASCAVAFTVYTNAGPSVWCFFAAILSALVFMHVRSRRTASSKKKSR
ncbi:hypothetical protein KJ781_02210 [Patescibacteria group bacterium]|nr:hypothetical protein [Patescibacteria group bacterium]MBU1448524.1 hypothetical protein [Patescibacteria group bacterium]MBU2613351.1 hypothetical protein [Patescibacteria group bacterium]